MTDFIHGFEFTFSSILEIIMIFSNSSTGDNNEECNNFDSDFITVYSFFGISIIFLITFSFLTKRVSFKKNICNGRPGLALPMNMINRHHHTIEYVLAFLSISEDIYGLVFQMEVIALSPIGKFFFKIILSIGVFVISYQIFAAIYIQTLTGYFIGIISTGGFALYFFIKNYMNISCLNGSEKYPVLFLTIILSIIHFTLFCTFVWKLIMYINHHGLYLNKPELSVGDDLNECYKYVKSLFNNGKSTEVLRNENKSVFYKLKNNGLTRNLKNRVYLRITGFTNPPRLVIGLSVGFYYAYRIFMDQITDITPIGWNIIRIILSKFSETKMDLKTAFIIASGNYSQYSKLEILNAYRYLTLFYTNLLIICLISAIVIGFINTAIQIFLILRNYRLSFFRINRKGFSSIIALKKTHSPNSLISGFVRYSGYQAACILWGVSIVVGFVFLLLFILIGIILLPLIYLENSWVRKAFIRYLPLVIATMLFNIIQELIIKYVFTKEHGRVMEINNRRAFMIFTHCAFFLNAMMGMFNSLKRIIIWILSGIFCFCRIDFSSLPIYLQAFDSGYMAYIGFLYTEQFHHNPIQKCFVDLLVNSRKVKNSSERLSINDINNYIQLHKTKYYRKWKVAYTLIKNPQLQVDRKRNDVWNTNRIIV